jgi:hypothetical protein
MTKNRESIYDGLLIKVTFGWTDRRRDSSGNTFRFEFFERGTTLATTIGPDRKSLAGFNVPACDMKAYLTDLEDSPKSCDAR